MDKDRFSTLKEKLKRDRELASLKRENEKTRKKLESKLKNESKLKIKILKEKSDEESNSNLTPQFDEVRVTENKIETKINENTQEKTTTRLSENYKGRNPNTKELSLANVIEFTQKDKNDSKSVISRKSVSKKPTKKRRKKQEQDSSLKKQRDLVKKRVQKHRSKLTEEQLKEKRRKDRERYKNKKEEGRVKNIESLSERARRKQRKKWKEASTRYRSNKKMRLTTQKYLTDNSPPTTDNEEVEENVRQQIIMPLREAVAKHKIDDNSLSNSPQQNNTPSRSNNGRQGSENNTPTSRKEVTKFSKYENK